MKAKHLVIAAVAVVAVLAVTVAPESFAAIAVPNLLVAAAMGGAMLVGDLQLLRSKELRQQRASLVEENRKVLERIEKEKDAARVKELETEWDRRDAEIVSLTKAIGRAETQEENERDLLDPVQQRRSGRTDPGEVTDEQRQENVKRYKRVFWDSLRYGVQGLDQEDQLLLRQGFRNFRGDIIDLRGKEARAMSTTVAAGGYTVPEGFLPELQQNMLAFGGVRPFARVFTTGSGNTIPIPTVDDTSNEASIVGEGSALTSPQDPVFGVINLGAFMYRTLCLVSLELLQDSAFDLEAWIRGIVAERVARGTNRHFTVGNGSTQPHGVIPASSSGRTATSATTLSYTDLVMLEHSVDPAYRNYRDCAFQFHDTTLRTLKTLTDSQNRPLWVAGVAVREPDTILGYKYGINQHMAQIAASNKSVAFGNFSKYMIRDVGQLLIIRANELHIGSGQIGFYVFSRHDGKLLDAGNDPIKHITHPSPD